MKTLRIGGVPEHFNLPIHLAKEEGRFDDIGIALEWSDYKGGTGAMVRALRNGDLDLCILLTEGITLDIINGNPSKIISEYVKTPLCWGIHTAADNPLAHHDQIYDKQYAISRLGSGSHLMAIIDAHGKGKPLQDDQFDVIQNLDGALASLKAHETDVFYWEKFTTKPYVDNGLLKRIGEFPTPWPSFVIAATDKALAQYAPDIRRALEVIHNRCQVFMEQTDIMVAETAKRYGLQHADAENWYHRTEWAVDGWVSDKMLVSVVYNLTVAGLIDKNKTIPNLIWKKE